VAYFIGAASIAGIPPFNGFASKQIVLAAVNGAANGTAVRGVGLLLSIASIGTVASFLKLSRIALPGPRRDAFDAAAIGAPGRLIYGPAVLLSLLCVAGGLFGREIVFFLIGVLRPAGDAASFVPGTLFSPTKIPDTLMTVTLGILLFFGVRSTRGGKITHKIRSLTPDLGTVLVMFVLGLGLFAGLAYI
jgi:formate hydrogenlyase subunit 3/multisubunit Na+/H+ antiporter MnhD subunit